MSLSSAPTFTPGSAGNVYTSNSLAASTSVTTSAFYLGVSGQTGSAGSTATSSALGGRVQIWNTGGGSVSATNGVQVSVYSTSDGTNYDTLAYGGTGFVIATVQSTVARQSFDLPPGQYKITLTNLDGSYATTVEVTLGTYG